MCVYISASVFICAQVHVHVWKLEDYFRCYASGGIHLVFYYYYCFILVYGYFAYTHVHVCLVPTEVREGIGSPGTGVTVCCVLPCSCWGSNQSVLEDQRVLLTDEPSLQASILFF